MGADLSGHRPRREFLREVIGALAGGAVLAQLESCRPPRHAIGTVDVGALTRDGSGVVSTVHGPDGAAILICRRSATEFTALSTICTHEGCPVNAPVDAIITCPCHGSQYDLLGQVLRGPALYSLTRYPVVLDRKRRLVTVEQGAAG